MVSARVAGWVSRVQHPFFALRFVAGHGERKYCLNYISRAEPSTGDTADLWADLPGFSFYTKHCFV